MRLAEVSVSTSKPVISVGLFVYNGEASLERALDSLLAQTFTEFELIISDNASTDRTQEICQRYMEIDSRVRYIRQEKNIGLYKNLKYVFDEARAGYFMWAAADDTRSPDYLEVNYNYLNDHPQYVASMSPNCYEGQEEQPEHLVKCSLEGGVYDRLQGFLSNCWKSHGVFNALIRTHCLRDSRVVGLRYFAADWSIIVDLLVAGPIKRLSEGKFIVGISGISSSSDPYKPFRTRRIEYLFPLFEFSDRFYQTVKTSNKLTYIDKLRLLGRLLVLNLDLCLYLVKAYLLNMIKLTVPQPILTWIRNKIDQAG